VNGEFATAMSDDSQAEVVLPQWQQDLIPWFERTFDLETPMGKGPVFLAQQLALRRGADPREAQPVVEYAGFEDDSLCSELKHVMGELEGLRRPYYEWTPRERRGMNDRSAAIAEVIQARLPEALSRGRRYQLRRLSMTGSVFAKALNATDVGSAHRVRTAVRFVAVTTTSTLVKGLISDKKILQNIRSESLSNETADELGEGGYKALEVLDDESTEFDGLNTPWIPIPQHVERWLNMQPIERIAEELSESARTPISAAEAFGRIFLWSRGEHHGADAFRLRDPAQEDGAFELLREFFEMPGRIFDDPGEGAKMYHQGALALIAAWRLTWRGVPTDADWEDVLGRLKVAFPAIKITRPGAVQKRWERLVKDNPLLRLLDGRGHDVKTLRKRALAEGFDLTQLRESAPWDAVTIYELRLEELWSELPSVMNSRVMEDLNNLDPYAAAIIVCCWVYGVGYVARILAAMGYNPTDIQLEDVNRALRGCLGW
jgi:hypothetical protein